MNANTNANTTTTYDADALAEMKLPQLREIFAEVTGNETKAPNKTYLIKTILAAQDAEPVAAPVAEPVAEPVASHLTLVEADDATDEPEAVEAVEAVEVADEPEAVDANGKPPINTPEEIEWLRAEYLDKVGRPTGSVDRGYLMWKIREAVKGAVTVGPIVRGGKTGDGTEFKTIPVRISLGDLAILDDEWKEHGHKSRKAYIMHALAAYRQMIAAG